MADLKPLFNIPENKVPGIGIFMSGSGSNAEEIIKYWQQNKESCSFEPVVLVTDTLAKSRTAEIGEKYNLPVVEHSLLDFYQQHGEKTTSIRTAKGWEIRELWTAALSEKLQQYNVDFGVFAGFVPLCNIMKYFPCLNVHPGDLTYKKDDKRYLVGLHTIPVEKAILEELDYMRSSVILTQPYEPDSDNMDEGPLLGISEEVDIDFGGYTFEQLVECAKARKGTKKPAGGYQDILAEIAGKNQDILKEQGDWIVFPRAIEDFACGRFFADAAGKLFYNIGKRSFPVETVCYSKSQKEIIFRS